MIRWQRLRGERGTMIPLYVLFIMIAVALLTIVLDTTQVYLQRRALQGVADGASLAAADGIDVSNLYDEGLDEEGRVELVRSQAAAAVANYESIVNRPATASHHRVNCDVGDIQANRVQVVCNRKAILPIVNYVSQGAGLGASVDVRTASWADANIAG